MAGPSRIDELRKKFDENPRRYFAPLANEYRKLGDYEQAIFICQEFLPQQPGHMSGHIVYGQALFEAGRHDEARTVFETALSLDPENLIALRHLGDIARAHSDTETARAWYRRVLDSDPRNEEIAGILQSLDAEPTTATVAGTSSPFAPAAPSPPSPQPHAASAAGGNVGAPPAAAPPPVTATTEAPVAQPAEQPVAESAFSPLAGFGPPPADSTASVPLLEHEADLDALFPTPNTSAGGNYYQDAPPLEPPPEPPAPPVAAVPELPASSPAAGAFVTETMAELYLQQGHREEALAVYRQLVALHPDDDSVRSRLRVLEGANGVAARREPEPVDAGPTIRDFLAALAVCRPRAHDAARARSEAAPAISATADGRDQRASASTRPKTSAPPRADDTVGGSLDALFTGAESAHRATTRSPLEAAFSNEPADQPERRRDDEATPALRGRPATPAATELSLDHVFRHATPSGGAQAQPAFSFDQFFTQQAQSEAAGAAPEPTRESQGTENDDIQQFNAWLEGLKKT